MIRRNLTGIRLAAAFWPILSVFAWIVWPGLVDVLYASVAAAFAVYVLADYIEDQPS